MGLPDAREPLSVDSGSQRDHRSTPRWTSLFSSISWVEVLFGALWHSSKVEQEPHAGCFLHRRLLEAGDIRCHAAGGSDRAADGGFSSRWYVPASSPEGLWSLSARDFAVFSGSHLSPWRCLPRRGVRLSSHDHSCVNCLCVVRGTSGNSLGRASCYLRSAGSCGVVHCSCARRNVRSAGSCGRLNCPSGRRHLRSSVTSHRVTTVSAAPLVIYAASAPAVEYAARAPAVTYAVLGPPFKCTAPAPAIVDEAPSSVKTYAAPSSVIEDVASAPVNE